MSASVQHKLGSPPLNTSSSTIDNILVTTSSQIEKHLVSILECKNVQSSTELVKYIIRNSAAFEALKQVVFKNISRTDSRQ
jgi:hypothetical protein